MAARRRDTVTLETVIAPSQEFPRHRPGGCQRPALRAEAIGGEDGSTSASLPYLGLSSSCCRKICPSLFPRHQLGACEVPATRHHHQSDCWPARRQGGGELFPRRRRDGIFSQPCQTRATRPLSTSGKQREDQKGAKQEKVASLRPRVWTYKYAANGRWRDRVLRAKSAREISLAEATRNGLR
jgi:hypothetical protein